MYDILDSAAIGLFLAFVAGTVGLLRNRKKVLTQWQESREHLSVEAFAEKYFGEDAHTRWAAVAARWFIEGQLERQVPGLRPDDDLVSVLVLTQWPHVPFAADLSAASGLAIKAGEIRSVRTVRDLVSLLAAKHRQR